MIRSFLLKLLLRLANEYLRVETGYRYIIPRQDVFEPENCEYLYHKTAWAHGIQNANHQTWVTEILNRLMYND